MKTRGDHRNSTTDRTHWKKTRGRQRKNKGEIFGWLEVSRAGVPGARVSGARRSRIGGSRASKLTNQNHHPNQPTKRPTDGPTYLPTDFPTYQTTHLLGTTPHRHTVLKRRKPRTGANPRTGALAPGTDPPSLDFLANSLHDCEGKGKNFPRAARRHRKENLATDWESFVANEGEAVLEVGYH